LANYLWIFQLKRGSSCVVEEGAEGCNVLPDNCIFLTNAMVHFRNFNFAFEFLHSMWGYSRTLCISENKSFGKKIFGRAENSGREKAIDIIHHPLPSCHHDATKDAYRTT